MASLKIDLKKDLFHISYHPDQVTPEQMLETIREKGFSGKIVTNVSAVGSAQKGRYDLTRLPESFQAAVAQARQTNKPLLLAFHGPG